MTRPPRPSPLYSLIAALSWPVARLVFRYRAYGQENLPVSGGYVLAAGHVSNLDPWPLGLALWPRRFLRFMAKSELFSAPILGPLIRTVNAIPIRRGVADMSGMARAIASLRDGGALVMFPEGSRMRDGELHPARPGVGMMAVHADVPIAPCYISAAGLAPAARLSTA